MPRRSLRGVGAASGRRDRPLRTRPISSPSTRRRCGPAAPLARASSSQASTRASTSGIRTSRPAGGAASNSWYRPVRPACHHARRSDRSRHGDDGHHRRRRRRRDVDRHGARCLLDRRHGSSTTCGVGHGDGDPCRLPVDPRSGRQPRDGGCPEDREQLMGVRSAGLQSGVPVGPPGAPRRRDRARIRGEATSGPDPARASARPTTPRRWRSVRSTRPVSSTQARAAAHPRAARRQRRTRIWSLPALPCARRTCSAAIRRPRGPRWRLLMSPARSRCSWASVRACRHRASLVPSKRHVISARLGRTMPTGWGDWTSSPRARSLMPAPRPRPRPRPRRRRRRHRVLRRRRHQVLRRRRRRRHAHAHAVAGAHPDADARADAHADTDTDAHPYADADAVTVTVAHRLWHLGHRAGLVEGLRSLENRSFRWSRTGERDLGPPKECKWATPRLCRQPVRGPAQPGEALAARWGACLGNGQRQVSGGVHGHHPCRRLHGVLLRVVDGPFESGIGHESADELPVATRLPIAAAWLDPAGGAGRPKPAPPARATSALIDSIEEGRGGAGETRLLGPRSSGTRGGYATRAERP